MRVTSAFLLRSIGGVSQSSAPCGCTSDICPAQCNRYYKTIHDKRTRTTDIAMVCARAQNTKGHRNAHLMYFFNPIYTAMSGDNLKLRSKRVH
jgi:hypothetical protein